MGGEGVIEGVAGETLLPEALPVADRVPEALGVQVCVAEPLLVVERVTDALGEGERVALDDEVAVRLAVALDDTLPVPLRVGVPVLDAEPVPVAVGAPLRLLVVCRVGAVSTRTRLLFLSAMIKLPPPSTASAAGLNRLALVPGPPSPLKLRTPFPTTVVMSPVPTSSSRMR
jgi:hypothetical protein